MTGTTGWLARALGVILVSSGLAGPVRAHVDYVTEEGPTGSPTELFAAVLTDPLSLALLAAGGLFVAGLVAGYLRFASSLPDIEVARRTLRSYRPYLPWMLRLSVGLPLVGAGFAGYLFSPSVPADARLLQVGIGFCLLFGLATRVVAGLGLLVYLVALAGDPALLLASEYVAGFLAIVVVGPGQPSADMLLRRLVVTDGTVASRVRGVTTPGALLSRLGVDGGAAPVVLRLFLGANFIYLGVTQKWLEPARAAAVVARYDLTAVVPVPPELWVFGAGLVEVAVGLAFVSGTFTRGAAAAGFVLLTTTLFGLPDDPVLAHVTLFGLSSALMVTGSGRFSLDARVVPALRRRFDPAVATGDEGRPAAD
ncbi:MAG: DoxX family protein [Haloarculaceae archaeon]